MLPMNTAPARTLAIIGRSSTGQARTLRVDSSDTARHPNAAYRRLAAVILGLDVVSLSTELRGRRLADRLLEHQAA
jgi:hypothetical protein